MANPHLAQAIVKVSRHSSILLCWPSACSITKLSNASIDKRPVNSRGFLLLAGKIMMTGSSSGSNMKGELFCATSMRIACATNHAIQISSVRCNEGALEAACLNISRSCVRKLGVRGTVYGT